MEVQSRVLRRRQTLTNSAAEFAERRAGIEVLRHLEDSPEGFKDLEDASEFVTELDRFGFSKDCFQPADYYKQSKQQMDKFRQTLQSFVTILRERNVESQLNIVIKDPDEFTVEYILGVINTIEESHENAAKTRSCKNFVRRCSRTVHDNRGIVEGILTMIPNDLYGSVISGGLTVALAAVEKHIEQREEIQNCLAEIPNQLETIQRFSEIHHASIRLHSHADAVMVSIFTVLERILERITRTWKKDKFAKRFRQSLRFRRRTSRRPQPNQDGDGHVGPESCAGEEEAGDKPQKRPSVADALADLQTNVTGFQKEVDICGQERLGRVENGVQNLHRHMGRLLQQAERIQTTFVGLMNQYGRTREDVMQRNLMNVKNYYYHLCASSPLFNARTVDHEEVKLLQLELNAISMRSRQENNSSIVSKWLKSKALRGFPYDPMADMKDCLEHVELLDPDEKATSHSILASDEASRWLEGEQSRILEVDLETPPGSLNNVLSFTSALLATTVRSTTKIPVLAFFCMHRNNDSPQEDRSGPIAMVKSFNSQLLRFIADHRPSVDLAAALRNQEFFSRAKDSLKDGLRLLEALLLSLPEGEMVFIIVDCLSRLSGSEKEGDKVIKQLDRIIRKREELVIKLMVSDALAGSYVKSAADISHHVLDSVGRGCAMDIGESMNDIARKVK